MNKEPRLARTVFPLKKAYPIGEARGLGCQLKKTRDGLWFPPRYTRSSSVRRDHRSSCSRGRVSSRRRPPNAPSDSFHGLLRVHGVLRGHTHAQSPSAPSSGRLRPPPANPNHVSPAR